jgi:hypothetical protein
MDESSDTDDELRKIIASNPELEDEDISLLKCEWAGCGMLFWEMEELRNHVHDGQ